MNNTNRFQIIFNTEESHNDWSSNHVYDLGLEIGNGFDLKNMAHVLSEASKVAKYWNTSATVKVYSVDSDGDIDIDSVEESYVVFGNEK